MHATTTQYRPPAECYQGAELLPVQDRHSAMQAAAMPSRRFNHLRWPDGRLTTLDGLHAYAPQGAVYAQPKAEDKPLNFTPAKPTKTYSAKDRAHAVSKLTEDHVRAIRAASAGGETRQSIAARYAISTTTVSSVVTRRTWTQVA